MNTDQPSSTARDSTIHDVRTIRRCSWHLAAVVIVAALLFRGGVLLAPGALHGDPDGYRAMAENLVQYGTFGHGQRPTAYRPPLYPLLLSFAMALGPWSHAAMALMHLAMGLATVWLTYRLGRQAGLGRYALAAAALVACDPILLAQSALVMTETLAALLAAVSLALLAGASRRPSPGRAAAAGTCMALAVLCRPTFLLWAILAAILLPWYAGRGGRASWRHAAVLLGCFAAAASLVLAPWAVRNQVCFGRAIVTTTHGGYTFLLANNPHFYQYLRSGEWGSVWSADELSRDFSSQVSRAGADDELGVDRLAYALAWQNIRREPAMFFYACAVRVGRLWAPLPHPRSPDEGLAVRGLRYGVGLWYGCEFLLAVAGILAVWRGTLTRISRPCRTDCQSVLRSTLLDTARLSEKCGPTLSQGETGFIWVWAILLAGSFTGVHTVYWTDMRMRAPLMPAVALAAAAGIEWIVGVVRRSKCWENR